MRIMRLQEVMQTTALSRSTIWRLERAGTFPRRQRLAARAVGWVAEDVVAWLRARFPGSNAPPPRTD